jgi:hypothetical protein
MAWSVSRAETWSCRFRYWLHYEQHVQPSQRVDPQRLHGRLVHVGLAGAYQHAALGNGWPAGTTMIAYAEHARTAINAYVDRDPITERQREAALAEVERVLRQLPIPAKGAILGVEMPFRMTVDRVTIDGVVDLILRTGIDTVHDRDWKTGAIPDEIVLHPQMGTYHGATRQHFPWARQITVGLYSTRRLEETIGTFSQETADHVLGRLLSKHREVTETARLVRQQGVSILDAYPPRASAACTRCDYRSYCPLFARASLPVRDEAVVAAEKKRVDSLIHQS